MKRYFVAVLLCIIASACATSAPPKDPEQVKKEIAEVERRLIVAVQRKDLATLDTIWDDEYFGTAPDGRTVTKKDLMAAVDGGAIELTSIEPEGLYVRLFGDVAVITGKAKVIAQVSGADNSQNVRGTGIFVKRTTGWRIAGVHVGPDLTVAPMIRPDEPKQTVK